MGIKGKFKIDFGYPYTYLCILLISDVVVVVVITVKPNSLLDGWLVGWLTAAADQ